MKNAHFDETRLMAVAFSDGLGDRLRTTDVTGRAIEVLRLNPELLEIPSFEIALRERVARLSGFYDPAFIPVVRIDHLGERPQVPAVVSERVPGRRLSSLLDEAEAARTALAPDRALSWLRQIVAAVARLHDYGHDIAHGALSPERLIVIGSGDIMVAEYVLGEAIEGLQWPRHVLWRRLRVAMPPSAGLSRVDQRADLVQIGTVALALVLGRRLRDDEYPNALPANLREASARVARAQPALAAGLAGWLARTLHHEHRSFGSVRDALAALDDLGAGQPPRKRAAATIGALRRSPPRAVPASQPAPVVKPRGPRASQLHLVGTPASVLVEGTAFDTGRERRAWWTSVRRIALVVLAVGFTASIGASHYVPPPAATRAAVTVVVDATPAGPPQPAGTAGPDGSAARGTQSGELLEAGILLPPGWIELAAPVDMTFLEGGATIAEGRAGRLAAQSGVHDIEVVNHTLGFRETRRITVRPGGVTRLVVQLPFGIVDLNASPWAEVWLDGQRIGETPIGNLSVPIGPHEFVFRHPELGERRHAVSLTTTDPVRISVDMTRH